MAKKETQVRLEVLVKTDKTGLTAATVTMEPVAWTERMDRTASTVLMGKMVKMERTELMEKMANVALGDFVDVEELAATMVKMVQAVKSSEK
jgi:hypothetical protein